MYQLTLQLSSYLPYEVEDVDDKELDDRKLVQSIIFEQKKHKEILKENSYCPICRYESGETVRLKMRDDGLIYCPDCNFKPIESGLPPPHTGQGRVLSANAHHFSADKFKSFRPSEIANKSYQKKLKRNVSLKSLHETNQVAPKALNDYDY